MHKPALSMRRPQNWKPWRIISFAITPAMVALNALQDITSKFVPDNRNPQKNLPGQEFPRYQVTKTHLKFPLRMRMAHWFTNSKNGCAMRRPIRILVSCPNALEPASFSLLLANTLYLLTLSSLVLELVCLGAGWSYPQC